MEIEVKDDYMKGTVNQSILSLEVIKLQQENRQLKEDILFCLKSIKQEMEMSIDGRTRQEMLSCYQILNEWSDKHDVDDGWELLEILDNKGDENDG